MFDTLDKDAVLVVSEPVEKEEALRMIITRACSVFSLRNCDSILTAIIDRESKLSTGIGLGIAVPHCRSDQVGKIVIAVMLIPGGVEYNSVDGQPVKLIFLIISPTHDVQGHIAILSTISHAVSDEETRMMLLNSGTPEELRANLARVQSWE
jgi:fructose PTS system EIIBC or EIIC component